MRIWKLFITVLFIALPVCYGLNLLASIQPKNSDDYLAIYTLGSEGLAENYFPGDQADILPGTQLSWYVGVYNHMSTLMLVKVEFKLLNLTMQGPDQVNGIPSQRDAFFDETQLLLSNETWTLPVVWSVGTTASMSGNTTEIHSLVFNNDTLTNNVETPALSGFNYRIVIELWVYNDATGAFAFQWTANGNQQVAWNEIWFNMTRISLLPGS